MDGDYDPFRQDRSVFISRKREEVKGEKDMEQAALDIAKGITWLHKNDHA